MSHSDTTRRIPRRRWGIGALLGIGVLINYIDRIGLSVAAPQIQEAFKLGPDEPGVRLDIGAPPAALVDQILRHQGR